MSVLLASFCHRGKQARLDVIDKSKSVVCQLLPNQRGSLESREIVLDALLNT